MDITGAQHPMCYGQESLKYNPNACRDGCCMHAEGKVFAVWRSVLISEQDNRATSDVELLQRLVSLTNSAQCWAVILSKGGHFSAAVFDLRPVPPSQHSKANAPLFKELAHKSYHRYVVRWGEHREHAVGCDCV